MQQIENKIWYKPMEIAQMGLIKSSLGDKGAVIGHYNFILELIKSGRLRAKNYSTGSKRPYWLVPEDEIARYHDTVTKVVAP